MRLLHIVDFTLVNAPVVNILLISVGMSFTLVIPDWRCRIPRLTNQNLLEISLTLFSVFVIAEVVGAVLSNSLSLLGDAASMSVDVVTYICNIYGEWAKNTNQRGTVRSRIIIEVAIPAISTISLLAVTIYILLESITLLRHPPSVNDVNTDYLYGYAAVNLLVDLTVSYLFYARGDDVFIESDHVPTISLDTSINFEQEEDDFGHLEDDLDGYMNSSTDADASTVWNIFTSNSNGNGSGAYHALPHNTTANSNCCTNSYKLWTSYFSRCCPNNNTPGSPLSTPVSKKTDTNSRKNLNMMSAFTHIMGDTMRTVAMFFAALISTVSGVDGDICDAYAALVVSFTILILCMNLVIDIYTAGLDIYRDEYSEYDSAIHSATRVARTPRHNATSSTSGGVHSPYRRVNDIDWDEVEEVEL